MPVNYEQHFAYHANAIAFGTRFSTPGAWESMGSVALPSVGGRATASATGYVLDGGFVTVRAAGSEVVGEEIEGPAATTYRTRATTWIEGLRIGPYLEIDFLRVQLESRHDLVNGQPAQELSFVPLELQYSPPRVCGQPWLAPPTPELGWMSQHPTFGAARADFLATRALPGPMLAAFPQKQIYSSGPAGAAPALYPVTEQGAPDPNELWVFAFQVPPNLGAVEMPCPGSLCAHAGAVHRGELAGFGLGWRHAQEPHPDISFRFGEYVVSHGRRRFTAVRMSMRRSPRSELVVGELALNGSTYP